jgi:hypothetical protein
MDRQISDMDWGAEFGEAELVEDFDDERLKDPALQNRIWTEVDTEDGAIIVSGKHFVNRLNYFITEKEFDPNDAIEVVD